jgi:hypothetical protein
VQIFDKLLHQNMYLKVRNLCADTRTPRQCHIAKSSFFAAATATAILVGGATAAAAAGVVGRSRLPGNEKALTNW